MREEKSLSIWLDLATGAEERGDERLTLESVHDLDWHSWKWLEATTGDWERLGVTGSDWERLLVTGTAGEDDHGAAGLSQSKGRIP